MSKKLKVNTDYLTWSLEKLYHFQCEKCSKWFSIGDFDIKKYKKLVCPLCNKISKIYHKQYNEESEWVTMNSEIPDGEQNEFKQSPPNWRGGECCYNCRNWIGQNYCKKYPEKDNLGDYYVSKTDCCDEFNR
jgi:hypothetical protein